MAPEVFYGNPYTTAVDVWTLGVCLYEMLTFKRPFKYEDLMRDRIDLDNLQIPKYINKFFEMMIRKTMAIDFKKRLTIDEVINLLTEYEKTHPEVQNKIKDISML